MEDYRISLATALNLHPDAIGTVDWSTIIQYVEKRTEEWKDSRKVNSANTNILWHFYHKLSVMLSLENPPTPSTPSREMESHLQNAWDILEGWDTFHTLPEVLGELLQEISRTVYKELTPGDIVRDVKTLLAANKAYQPLVKDMEKLPRMINVLQHTQKALVSLVWANKELMEALFKERGGEEDGR